MSNVTKLRYPEDWKKCADLEMRQQAGYLASHVPMMIDTIEEWFEEIIKTPKEDLYRFEDLERRFHWMVGHIRSRANDLQEIMRDAGFTDYLEHY